MNPTDVVSGKTLPYGECIPHSRIAELTEKIDQLKVLQKDLQDEISRVYENPLHPIESIRQRLQDHNLFPTSSESPLKFVIDALSDVSRELGRLDQMAWLQEDESGARPLPMEEKAKAQAWLESKVEVSGKKRRTETVSDSTDHTLTAIDFEHPSEGLLQAPDEALILMLRKMSFVSLRRGVGATNHRLRKLALHAAYLNVQQDLQSFLVQVKEGLDPASEASSRLLAIEESLEKRLQEAVYSTSDWSIPFVDLHDHRIDILKEVLTALMTLPKEARKSVWAKLLVGSRSEFLRELPLWIQLYETVQSVAEADHDEKEIIKLGKELKATLSKSTYLSSDLLTEIFECISTYKLPLMVSFVLKWAENIPDIFLVAEVLGFLPPSEKKSNIICAVSCKLLFETKSIDRAIDFLKDAKDQEAIVHFISLVLYKGQDSDAALEISKAFDNVGMSEIISFEIQKNNFSKVEELIASVENWTPDQTVLLSLFAAYILGNNFDAIVNLISRQSDPSIKCAMVQTYEQLLQKAYKGALSVGFSIQEGVYFARMKEVAEIYKEMGQDDLRASCHSRLEEAISLAMDGLLRQFERFSEYALLDQALAYSQQIMDTELKATCLFKIAQTVPPRGNMYRFLDIAKQIHIPSLPHDEQAIMFRKLDELKNFEGTTEDNQQEIKKLYIRYALSQTDQLTAALQCANQEVNREKYKELMSLIISELMSNSASWDKALGIALDIPNQEFQNQMREEIEQHILASTSSPDLSLQGKAALLEKLFLEVQKHIDSVGRYSCLHMLMNQSLYLFYREESRSLPFEEQNQLISNVLQCASCLPAEEQESQIQQIFSAPRVFDFLLEKMRATPFAKHMFDSLRQSELFGYALDFFSGAFVPTWQPYEIVEQIASYIRHIQDPGAQSKMQDFLIREIESFHLGIGMSLKESFELRVAGAEILVKDFSHTPQFKTIIARLVEAIAFQTMDYFDALSSDQRENMLDRCGNLFRLASLPPDSSAVEAWKACVEKFRPAQKQ